MKIVLQIAFLALLAVGCRQNPPVPGVAGSAKPAMITDNSASGGGTVVSNGAYVIARGVCWSTRPNPGVESSQKTIDGAGPGSFSSAITGLKPSTLYYLRVYATSSGGTRYGELLTFTTAPKGFVLADGGTFLMGNPSGPENERPAHRVTLSSFYVARSEVANGEWKSVMGSLPSGQASQTADSDPVTRITWNQAIAFCNTLSAKDGLEPVYAIEKSGALKRADFTKNGYRLPTESEWEYAARRAEASRGALGRLDVNHMTSSVWEFCWDRYGSYPAAARINPRGPSSGEKRVIRGGSWSAKPSGSLFTERTSIRSADSGYSFIGLRLVRGL